MYVVVAVKMVPDTTQVSIDPVTNTLIREGVPFITNPFDTHAVEEALRLKDRYGARVTAISSAEAPATAAQRRSRAARTPAGFPARSSAIGSGTAASR